MVQLSKLAALKQRAAKIPNPASPGDVVWKGPVEDGITFSMLSRFLTCRERFRLATVYGLRTADVFDHKIQYGHMWHECEQAVSAKKPWMPALERYYVKLQEKYKFQNIPKEIHKWYMVCRTQFPIYEEYWSKHKDNTHRTPLFQEMTFSVMYDIGGGRKVRLRGKQDAGDLIGPPKSAVTYLQENKTKGDIEEQNIQKQLSFDCQTMFYLTALHTIRDNPAVAKEHGLGANFLKAPIGGVRYNVIRRPLSGGKGNIKQHKPSKKNPNGESDNEFYARLASIIDGSGKNRNDEDQPGPEYFFMRWQADINRQDVANFENRFLKPILHQLYTWYDWIMTVHRAGEDPFTWKSNDIHWQHPFGVTNMINEGYSHDLDEFLRTGSMVGLRKVDTLFEELT